MSKIKYSFEDYNEFNVLKIPLSLILTTVYLLKYFVILIFLPVLSKIPRVGESVKLAMPYVEQFAHNHINLLLLISSIPAVFIIVGMFRRIPKTQSPFIRRVWANGRMLLLVSAIVDLALLTVFLLLGLKTLNELLILILYLDAMIALYLMRSQRVRDVFAEFPDYKAPEEK
jgi:hypothetical protein